MMTLNDYLRKIKDGEAAGNVLDGLNNHIDELSKDRFILSYLKLKEAICEIHAKNSLEEVTINLSIVQYDSCDYLYVDVFKKGSDYEDYDYDQDELDYLDYDTIDVLSNKSKRLNVEPNSSGYKEYEIIDEYKVKLQNCLEFLNAKVGKEQWFGSIVDGTKTIYLNGKDLPDIEEWILGSHIRPLLNKAILEDSMPINESEIKPTKAYKI